PGSRKSARSEPVAHPAACRAYRLSSGIAATKASAPTPRMTNTPHRATGWRRSSEAPQYTHRERNEPPVRYTRFHLGQLGQRGLGRRRKRVENCETGSHLEFCPQPTTGGVS